MNDPQGFLQHRPQLEAIARQEPSVMAAIAAGDGIKLHKALVKYRARTQGQADNAFVDELLRDRRFFLTPIKKAPSMHTVNSIGTRLSGKRDLSEDGTYVSTLYVVALFIPLVPLGAYLVSDAGKNSWNFYGRVPLDAGARRVGKIFAALAFGALAVGVGSYVMTGMSTTMYVLNGLSRPLVVHVGDKEVKVAPHGREAIKVSTGKTHFRAELAGQVVEELDAELVGHQDLVAYNVLGAAPLYRQSIVYTTKTTTRKGDDGPPPIPLCGGASLISQGHVNYLFQDPPSSISMKGNTTTRSQVTMLNGGWPACAMLLQAAKQDSAIPLFVAKMRKADPSVVSKLQ